MITNSDSARDDKRRVTSVDIVISSLEESYVEIKFNDGSHEVVPTSEWLAAHKEVEEALRIEMLPNLGTDINTIVYQTWLQMLRARGVSDPYVSTDFKDYH
jgi:hypothetical protein